MEIPYGFPVYPVDSCPLSKSAWESRSRNLNCSNDLTYMNRYFCIPNSKLTTLVEFCYDTIRPMVQKDYCIVLADSGTIDYRGCLHFTDGCPTDNYLSDTVYNYPKCLDINGKKSCFTASPECNETQSTADKTTLSYVQSSVYREINSSLSHFLMTTTETSSNGNSSSDKISSSTLKIILILVMVLVLLCIALGLYINFRRHGLQICKKRNDYAADNGPSEDMVRFLSNESAAENDTSTDGMRLPVTSEDDSLSEDSQGEDYDEKKTNIKSRRIGDKTYICNNGLRTQIKLMVNSKNIVMVSGGPGSGKKSTLWHIAFLLEKDGYEVVQVNRLDEITTYENTSKRQMFVCENPFGLFYLDKELLQYLDRSDDLLCISNKKSKIVFTCRSDIRQHVKKWKFYQYINVIDLNEPSFRWQCEERRDMYSRICKQKRLSETIQNLPDHDFYPLSCHLFSEITEFQEQKANYFQKPLESIMCFLDDLKRNNKLLYDTLIVCLFLENSPSDEMDVLNTIMSALCVSDVHGYMNKIEKEMKKSNIFITSKNDEKFGFKNGLLFEVIAFHYGMSHAEDILLHMDIHFLSKNVRVSENEQTLSTDLVISLKKTDLVLLAERLLKELENLNPYDVFSVQCWSNSDFMNEFLTLLSKRSYEKIKSIFLEETNLSIICYVLPLKERVKDAKNLENIAWYRQKLLEDRREDHTCDNRVHYTRSIRVLNWVVANAQTELLKFIMDKHQENESDMRLFGSSQIEQTRSLVLACFSDSDETVELVMQFFNQAFINKTCDVKNWKTKKEQLNIHRKFTPLTAACFAISLPIVKKIIGKGADVNQKDENGNLPLTLASQLGSLSLVEYLVNHAADVNECDIWGRSALICAAEGGSSDVASFLITKIANIDACDENGQSSLYRACKRGHLHIVCKLLESNANVNLCDNEHKSPLYWASQIGHLEIVKKLVAKGANVNLCDKKKKSSLYCASKRGYLNVVIYLAEHHAAIDSCTTKMRSPLFRASKRGHLHIVKYLLGKGSNVNKTDEHGESPLYCASKRGHTEIVKELLENKAYVDILNAVHQTALYWAAQKGHSEIAKMLINYNPNINHVDAKDKREKSPLYCASKRGYLPIVKLLLEANADVNSCNVKGKSSLYRASKRGHLDVVRVLVQKKADVNQCDKDGKSPLYWASLRGNSKIVNFLVKNNARVNQCDKTNCSPLYVAAKNGHLDVVKDLCRKGADINITDGKGKSALDLAYRKGHHDVVEFLRGRRAM